MDMNHEFNKFIAITVILRLDFALGRSGLENTGTQRSNFYLPEIFLQFLSPASNSPPSPLPLTTEELLSTCLAKGTGRKTEASHISHYI